jgi:membrane peptidoglycan carboxypeptidase
MSFSVQKGPSSQIIFPKGGPFDERRGYTRIPAIQGRLEAQGYRVVEQARFSPQLLRVASWGIAPPYREPSGAGLVIRGMGDLPLFDFARSDRIFQDFREIPPLLVHSLLLIENRELEAPPDPRSNPVVEWDRMAKAVLVYGASKLGLPLRAQGGSTLATQLEKYRHSAQGRTNSIFDKLQQVTGATLRVYREGPDTTLQRREIILDYLNTVPMAAAPGYGELHGIQEGLYAWFGLHSADVSEALASSGTSTAKVHAYKHVLSLLCAVRAPTYYLVQNRSDLEARVNLYIGLIEKDGLIDAAFAKRLREAPISFMPHAPRPPDPSYLGQKASNAIRLNLVNLLGVQDFYDLDRLHLDVSSTIDVELQNRVAEVFEKLKDPDFVKEKGLREERLLSQGDPTKVVYSLMLFERTPRGNVLRVHADNLSVPFDINEGVKLELGSTAKLRTLAHYLDVVSELYDQLLPLDSAALHARAQQAGDPITLWVAQTLSQDRNIQVDALLEKALDRQYSASPYEAFFTGGGIHTFGNFDRKENGTVRTVREATRQSTNLVYIRLMRDLVRFHQARLQYDPDAVISDPDNPTRRQMIMEIAEDEAKQFLMRAFKKYQNLSPAEVAPKLLGTKAKSARHQAILFYAWSPKPQTDVQEALSRWLAASIGAVTPAEVQKLARAYGNPRLTLADYAYLLKVHPLDLWSAGERIHDPSLTWNTFWNQSRDARSVASAWLLLPRNRRAQDLRLRIRIEQDAFTRMTPYWRRLQFPFERLVPSYATAIGSSCDRPAALAELMGIIANDGLRQPSLKLERLKFAAGTPYHTVIEPTPPPGTRVMPSSVARAIRGVLAGVVEQGTARRLAGAFRMPDGTPVQAGGKTGSGDNRMEAFGRGGQVLSARVLNRTATFVFYIGNRYHGVLTAFVPGQDAADYRFTSALPVSILKLLSPAINERLANPEPSVIVAEREAVRKSKEPEQAAAHSPS